MSDIDTVKVNNTTYNVRDNYVVSELPDVQEDIEEIFKPLELGLKVDFRNSIFTRLGAAVGLLGGSDFDKFPMYKRRRCNLADDGTVTAYLGDGKFKVDGSNGQVMVEQPKFYYKVVVPAQSETDKWISYPNSPKEIEYWVSDQPLQGYKLHPAFRNTNMQEIDYFYEGAYDGCISDSKLGSISGVKPLVSQTRATFRTYATNRGSKWRQETIWSVSADQMLMVIEYGMLNMQTALGYGYVGGSSTLSTGILNSYGNASYGTANQTTAVQWRGKENPWGNIYKWIDGINISDSKPYIANSYTFTDNTTSGYTALAFSVPSSNWISAFGYDSNFDWLMLPIEANSSYGSSSIPVGDYVYSASGWRVCRLGGYWSDGLYAGPFNWNLNSSQYSADSVIGARLLYVG